MLSQVLTACGIPERSRLISLAPIGIGTPLVESLPSYLHRLADAHWMKLYRMIVCLLPELNRRFTQGGHLRANWSNNQTALAAAFSSFTKRSDLNQLTLDDLSSLVSPSGLFRTHRAWCPACLVQMGDQPYQPILWNLTAVSCCDIHRRKLQERCHACNSEIRVWGEGCFAPCCPTCKADLTQSPQQKTSTWELWKAHQCGEMLTLSHRLATPHNLDHILKKLLFVTFENKIAAARAAGIGASFIYQAGTNSETTSVEHLLRVAYVCSISLPELLFADLELLSTVPKSLPHHLTTQRPRYTNRQLEKKCRRLLETSGSMTARQVCITLRISALLLRKKCPTLYQELKLGRK